MNNMENTAPKGVENNIRKEGLSDIVDKIQVQERELRALKTNQEEIRQMPDRAEKNSLLGEIEDKIRNTIDTISDLQDKKMELLKAGDEKFIAKEPLQEFWIEPAEMLDHMSADDRKLDRKEKGFL